MLVEAKGEKKKSQVKETGGKDNKKKKTRDGGGLGRFGPGKGHVW